MLAMLYSGREESVQGGLLMPRQHVRRRKDYDDFNDWLDNEGDEDKAFDDLRDRYGSVTGAQKQYIDSYFVPIVEIKALPGHYRYRRTVDKHVRGQFASRKAFEAQG